MAWGGDRDGNPRAAPAHSPNLLTEQRDQVKEVSHHLLAITWICSALSADTRSWFRYLERERGPPKFKAWGY